MNRKKQQNLTDLIRKGLQEYEEPYVLGSWERFQQHKYRKSKIRTTKIISTVAASVLLMLTFLYAWNRTGQTTSGQQQVAGLQEEQPVDVDTGNDGHDPRESLSLSTLNDRETTVPESEEEQPEEREPIDENTLVPAAAEIPETRFSSITHKPIYPEKLTDKHHTLLTESQSGFTNIQNQEDLIITPPSHRLAIPLFKNSSAEKFDENLEAERNLVRPREKDITLSIAYASLMNIQGGQTDWGMGGGLFADWNVTRNVAFSSGLFLAQNRLKFDSNEFVHEDILEGRTTLTNVDDFAYMQVDLVSMEIPFSLRYSFADQFSVSAGISSVAFLKERYNYTFEYQQFIHVFPTNDRTGQEVPTPEEITIRTTQEQSEPSLNRMDWAAFYTFSAGYQHELTGRYTLLFEPFVKIPTRGLTSRDIEYVTGGLLLKFNF